MKNNHLEPLLNDIDKLNLLSDKLSRFKSINIKTLNGSSVSLVADYISRNTKRPIVIISNEKEFAEDLLFDFEKFFKKDSIANLIPKRNPNAELGESDHYGWLIEALNTINNDDSYLAVCQPELFELKIPQKGQISKNKITLKKNSNINFEDFKQDLALNGFERVEYVAKQGEFSVRGGIVDIFPISFDNPLRVEFWGNEIESIREFDKNSQRSISEYDEKSFVSKIFHTHNAERNATLIDYLDDNTVIILHNKELIKQDYPDFSIPENYNVISINSFDKADIRLNVEPQQNYNSSVKLFAKSLQEKIIEGYRIIVCADGDLNLNRIKELITDSLLQEDDLDIASPDQTISNILWLNNTVSKGFSIPEEKISVFTEHEIFNRHRNITSNTGNSLKLSLDEIKKLSIGDLVVHEDKGIGMFEGFKTVNIGESKQDCIQLAFEGGDKLFVNMNYIHKIQKYSAQEGDIPKLSKLGSTAWLRKKNRIKKKIKDISRELIKLYAKRKMQPGFSFSNDNVWQKEFEASFIYEDTPDQISTTKEIKDDMESEHPMDRLVCGDVGFGKTEVAIRAAFKAVQSGKQVAVLVPTTVLAQQHFMTFKDRLNKYPVNVDVISRFRTKKEQTKILEKLKSGSIDILIGTHRLLSKDIEFKDLGLLVIDEEQRFGVSAKEKLRKLRETIDTLTLTATPIPRTLNFSLMGARDLSVIQTPPRNRIPVQTEIIEWEDDKLKESIEYEVDRNGQIFFVNDTVKDLEKLYTRLKMLMPNVRFATAHGQLKPSELEKIMQNFISGKFDVLLTTKIVESGLDIPNANTMLINNAQNFGLAELYQLRGRVGRSNKQAYCYLVVPENKKLTENSVKRLQAIEEFTELGSGFQLSLRDLEIRGAGNLLGAEQSGAIFDIGFELYQKVLDEAVKELKQEEFKHIFESEEEDIEKMFENDEVSIELDVDALIPEDFIKSDTERFSIYKRLFAVRNNKELMELRDELKDRYGILPEELVNLLFAIKLRTAAIKTGLDKVLVKDNLLTLVFPENGNNEYFENAFPIVLEYIQSLENALLKQGKKRLTCEIELNDRSEAADILWKIKKSMEFIEV